MPEQFQRGDRVRLRQPILGVARGTCGTIILDYLWVRDWYDVQFAPGGRIHPVYAADLERLPPCAVAPPDTDTDATPPPQG
jgi:hypothetical protein